MRTEWALKVALPGMYVQGVSTRKVITVLQALLGPDVEISSTQVNRAAKQLDAGLAAWREGRWTKPRMCSSMPAMNAFAKVDA